MTAPPSPPEPVEGRERLDLAELAFRWRSYLPLGVIAMLAVGVARGAAVDRAAVGAMAAVGALLAAAGIGLRMAAVGRAPAGTSGRHRRQYAAELNTAGLYARVRHPLYLGNLLVWGGVSVASGWPLGAAASVACGALLFGLIVRHEDRYLAARFGDRWRRWAATTPALFPRLAVGAGRQGAAPPFSIAAAVRSEYSTAHTVGLLLLGFELLRRWAEAAPLPGWLWALLVANSALYLTVRALRARLEPSSGATRS